MLWNGIVLGTIMFVAFAGIWVKLPPLVKLMTLWSPLLTDVGATVVVFILNAGISSSIIGLTSGLWCGLLFSFVLLVGETPLRAYARRELEQRKARGRARA